MEIALALQTVSVLFSITFQIALENKAEMVEGGILFYDCSRTYE